MVAIEAAISYFCATVRWAPFCAAVCLVFAGLLTYLAVNEGIRYSARVAGFGGPRGWPVVGNLWHIRTNAAEQYRRWARTHGPVYQIMLGNVPVIVVNSAKAANAVFLSNSHALSSRPEFYTFHKIVSDTAGTTIGTSPYSDSLKRRRKGAATALNRTSVATYVPALDTETRTFISELFSARGQAIDPMPCIQRLSLSLALTLNWGVRMDSQANALFAEITAVEEAISRFRSTTGNLQDYVPLLRLDPFARASRSAREMRRRRDAYLGQLNRELDQRIRDGTHRPCIQANVILDQEAKLNRAELVSISLTMLSGGLDTLTTLVAWSIALLAQRPDVQETAYAAIEKEAGTAEVDPLWDPQDDQKCAYVVALARECLRYFTVLRLALPRCTIKDVVYEGKTIPKGAVVFLNAWACNMDTELWDDPEEFRPERFLLRPDAPVFTYGVGYRMCAGYVLANRELYLIFMRLLASFRIQPHDVVETHPVRGNSDPTSLVALPHRYKALFVPRDLKRLEEALARVGVDADEKC